MNNFVFEQKTIDILEFISNDITNIKNPIKYFNRIYKNHLKQNNDFILDLFNKLTTKLNESKKYVDSLEIKNKHLVKICWDNLSNLSNLKNYDHNYPMFYNAVMTLLTNANKQLISFEKFNDLYNKKKISPNDVKPYFEKYADLYYSSFGENITSIDYNNNVNNINNDELLKQKYIQEIINALKYFQNGHFVSLNIKHYVENNINSCKIYDFDFIKIYFFSNNNITQTHEKLIYELLIISKWIHSISPNYKINFMYFDCPINKTMEFTTNTQNTQNSISFKYLSTQNVNSGSSSSNNCLMIWRREEVFKVLIHELIHYLNLDVKYDMTLNKLFNYNIGKIKYPILINETITEILAQFFHTIYINNKIKQDSDFERFCLLYEYEQIFSWYQFAKIMEYYGIEKFKEKYIRKKFNQSTNVFVYYILKSILTLNFADILGKFNYLHNTNNTNTDYTSKECNVNECIPLVKYIKKTLSNPKKIIKFINKIIKRLEFFDNTLRMTILNEKI
jgi:hypothetical protein